MTIVQPNKNNLTKLNLTIGGMALVLVSIIFGGVFAYNDVVDFRHELSRVKTDLGRVEVQNAELKNSFYKIVDAGKLEKLALSGGLILDKNPQYFGR